MGKKLVDNINFKEEDYPYCEGIDQIKSFLNNKNNDKKIDNNDAYICNSW